MKRHYFPVILGLLEGLIIDIAVPDSMRYRLILNALFSKGFAEVYCTSPRKEPL